MSPRLSRSDSRVRTRSDLVHSAARLFARNGVTATSIEAIAEEAGYSRGAYHSNFGSREELLDAVVAQTVELLAPQLSAVLKGSEPAPVRLELYISRYLAFCQERRVETRALLAVVRHRQATSPGSYDDAVDDSVDEIRALFEEGQHAGTMRSFDVTMMAGMLRRTLDAEAARIVSEAVSAAYASTQIIEIFVRATRTDDGASRNA